MHLTQTPAKALQVTGAPGAIDWALDQGLLPDAHFHAAQGLTWLEVAEISDHVEAKVIGGGCKVHRRT